MNEEILPGSGSLSPRSWGCDVTDLPLSVPWGGCNESPLDAFSRRPAGFHRFLGSSFCQRRFSYALYFERRAHLVYRTESVLFL